MSEVRCRRCAAYWYGGWDEQGWWCPHCRPALGLWWLGMLGFAMIGPAAAHLGAHKIEKWARRRWNEGDRAELSGMFMATNLLRRRPAED